MNSFKESGLVPEILEAISELGFETPTPIQQQTIPAILTSTQDIVALAQTGTGKTAAFGLPILHLTDFNNKNIQTLVLCPTRELCMQIASDLSNYSKYIQNFTVVAVYGGANIAMQIRSIKSGAQIIVGTPGRVLDLISRKVLKLGFIRWLVLDESDEMLNMGFKDDLDSILSETPSERQTLLFSATMPKGISEIARNYMKSPVEISVGKRNAGADNVTHHYYMVQARDRYLALKRIVDMNPSIYSIVFCRTRIETKDVADKLMQDGYNADALHGDLSQPQRDYVMNRFRIRNLQILVATDVAARGLDVTDLTHIINYNLPDDLEIYVHRSGRTGRAGKSGVSISIIHSKESGRIRDLERITRKTFEHKMVPGGKEICEKQLFNLIDKVEKTEINNLQIEQYLDVIYKKLEWLSREDLIKHFFSIEFNRFLAYYKDAPDLNVGHRSDKRPERERTRESRSKSFSRFYINLGTKDGIDALGMIGLINKYNRGYRVEIGKIDILRKFSFFEVDSGSEKEILSSFEKASFKGNTVTVQLSAPDIKNKGRYESAPPARFNKRKRERTKKEVHRNSGFKDDRR